MSRKRNRGRQPRHSNGPHANRIRVRGKRLDQIDSTKVSLAYWLLAKRVAEGAVDAADLNETEVCKLAETLDDEEVERLRGRA